MARLKISSSLESFKILKFFKIWALRVGQIQVEIGSERGSKSGRGEWGLGVGGHRAGVAL